jgi:hypothetical protein
MGISSSVELADHFKGIKEWTWGRVSSILRTYTNDEYDFGLDATAVMNLTSIPISDAKAIVNSLSQNDSGVINALSLLVVIICLAESKQRMEPDRIDAIFGLLDFDGTSKISKDELTILMLCIGSAFSSILERQDERPSDAIMSDITTTIYKRQEKKMNSSISKKEFTTFCIETFKELGGQVDSLFEFFVNARDPPEEGELVNTSALPVYDDVAEEMEGTTPKIPMSLGVSIGMPLDGVAGGRDEGEVPVKNDGKCM